MKHSSRTEPCPICGRNVDDKCRWTETAIFCYFGDSFHPPMNLNKGDVVEAFESSWKLLYLQGGFSGGSYVFTRYSSVKNNFVSREERQRLQRLIDENTLKLQKRINNLRKLVQKSYALKDFQQMTLQDFCAATLLLDEATEECESVLQFIYANRSRVKISRKFFTALPLWKKQVERQRNDFVEFQKLYLE